MSQVTEFKFECDKAGSLWVKVIAAQRDSFFQDGETVEVTNPTVRISTFPGASYNDPQPLTIRGRRYTVDMVFDLHSRGESSEPVMNRHPHGQWRSASKIYDRGIQNEAGSSVGWNTATHKQIYALVEGVRDKFVTSHPQWADVSRRLLIESDYHRAMDELTRLQEQLDEAQMKVDALKMVLDTTPAPGKATAF